MSFRQFPQRPTAVVPNLSKCFKRFLVVNVKPRVGTTNKTRGVSYIEQTTTNCCSPNVLYRRLFHHCIGVLLNEVEREVLDRCCVMRLSLVLDQHEGDLLPKVVAAATQAYGCELMMPYTPSDSAIACRNNMVAMPFPRWFL